MYEQYAALSNEMAAKKPSERLVKPAGVEAKLHNATVALANEKAALQLQVHMLLWRKLHLTHYRYLS